MSGWQEPIGADRINLTARRHRLRVAQAHTLARILEESTTVDTQRYTSGAGGDNTRLRGIPAIGRGVTGAVPGSVPHQLGG